MYNLMVDVVNDLVIIELYGSLSEQEINAYVEDLQKITKKYESKLYSILIIANRLHPLSQKNIPNFKRATQLVLIWAKSIAVVNGNRTLTLYQMKRIVAEVREQSKLETPLIRFRTRKEAMEYIFKV